MPTENIAGGSLREDNVLRAAARRTVKDLQDTVAQEPELRPETVKQLPEPRWSGNEPDLH
jgi:hypothetical protein